MIRVQVWITPRRAQRKSFETRSTIQGNVPIEWLLYYADIGIYVQDQPLKPQTSKPSHIPWPANPPNPKPKPLAMCTLPPNSLPGPLQTLRKAT